MDFNVVFPSQIFTFFGLPFVINFMTNSVAVQSGEHIKVH